MEGNINVTINNYLNVLANDELKSMFSEVEILKMKMFVKEVISNELKNITSKENDAMKQFR